MSRRRAEALAGMTVFLVDDTARGLAREILTEMILLPVAASDAIHAVVASLNQVNILLTWNCRHLGNRDLLRSLREFVARGESDRQVENLRKLIEEAGALALVGVKETGVRVSYDFDPWAQFVLADKVQIQQVLLNLLRNAIEAMQETVRKQLTLSSRLVDAETVEIKVTDTGSGIAPDIAGQLFQPFVTSKRHGMGVGLSISRTIVEAHGGKLTAEANPGGGTIFRMTLRAVDKEELDNVE
mgnify:CR=1 FL=1